MRVAVYNPSARDHSGSYFSAWTDARGEFRVKDVPAGKYFVSVEAPGIIRNAPPNAEEEQKDLISVSVDGASATEVTVKVKRGGAVAGKVTYPDGDPAVNASIRVLRKKDGKWVPVYVGGMGRDRELTDDRGLYRISGLVPGEYVVGAAEQKMGVELTANDDPEGGNLLNRALLQTAYFGGSITPNGATVLRIDTGDEKEDVNITLSNQPAQSISGVVILTADKRPVPRARLSLRKKVDEGAAVMMPSELEGLVTNSDDNGAFTFEEVPEGSYTLTVSPPRFLARRLNEYPTSNQAAQLPGGRFATKQQDVVLAGADLNNLTLEVSAGSSISGVVTVEGGGALPRPLLIYPEVSGMDRRSTAPTPIRVQPDGTFSLESVPAGRISLRVVAPPDNRNPTKSITQGTTDLMREPLQVKDGEEVTGIRIVISAETTNASRP